jgi:DnaJ-domain-containing protein 1
MGLDEDPPPPEARPEPEPPPPGRPGPAVAVLIEHYRTLGLSLTATRDEIAAAFRKLSVRCHPDKVAHLDEDFQRLAERKFRELRTAYESILAEIGESDAS